MKKLLVLCTLLGVSVGYVGAEELKRLAFPWYIAYNQTSGAFMGGVFVSKEGLTFSMSGVKEPLELSWSKLHKAEQLVQDPKFNGFKEEF